MEALNLLLEDKASVLNKTKAKISELQDSSEIKSEIEKKDTRLGEVMEDLEALRHNHALLNQDYEKYFKTYNEKSEEAKALGARIDELNAKIQSRLAKAEELQRFLNAMAKLAAPVSTFEDAVFFQTIEKILARTGELEFRFKDGSIIRNKL